MTLSKSTLQRLDALATKMDLSRSRVVDFLTAKLFEEEMLKSHKHSDEQSGTE